MPRTGNPAVSSGILSWCLHSRGGGDRHGTLSMQNGDKGYGKAGKECKRRGCNIKQDGQRRPFEGEQRLKEVRNEPRG